MIGSKQKPSSSPHSESLVMQKYLQGKSMNQISKAIRISKGKVHYIIKDWKESIESTDIDKMWSFKSS